MSLIFGRYTPDEVIIQLLVNADPEEFTDLCTREELRKFCGLTPEANRMFEERSKRLFPELLQFKEPNQSWRQFYERIFYLVSTPISTVEEARDLADLYCRLRNNLMELKIIHLVYGVLPSVEGANSVAANGKLEELEWLEARSGPRPNLRGVNAAKRNGHNAVVAYLEMYGIRPTARVLFM